MTHPTRKSAREYAIKYRRTKKGLIHVIYLRQVWTSRRRGHHPPTYSRKELEAWILSQEKFHTLYDSWVQSGFETMEIPSCDRIDETIGYTLSNIQLMSWRDNHKKASLAKKYGVFGGNSSFKPVEQLTTDGEPVRRYISINQAARSIGLHRSNISNVCAGKQNSAGGYRWRFVSKAN